MTDTTVAPTKRAELGFSRLRADRERLDRIDRYTRGEHDGPCIPRSATEEYKLLAKRAISHWLPLLVKTPSQAMAVDGYRRSAGPGGRDRPSRRLGTTTGGRGWATRHLSRPGFFAGTSDLLRLWGQQVADLAAEDDADDVQIVELERDRLTGPQPGHLPETTNPCSARLRWSSDVFQIPLFVAVSRRFHLIGSALPAASRPLGPGDPSAVDPGLLDVYRIVVAIQECPKTS